MPKTGTNKIPGRIEPLLTVGEEGSPFEAFRPYGVRVPRGTCRVSDPRERSEGTFNHTAQSASAQRNTNAASSDSSTSGCCQTADDPQRAVADQRPGRALLAT